VVPLEVHDPARFVEQVRAELDERGIARIDLFGWSLGAHLALDFARAAPERVGGLTLAAFRPRFPPAEMESDIAAFDRDPEACRAAFRQWTRVGLHRGHQERVAPHLAVPLAPDEVSRLRRWLVELARRDVSPRDFEPLPPVQFVHGKKDAIAPRAEIQALAAQIPGSSLEVFDEGGHLPFLDPRFMEWFRARSLG
jgi:pimeloyl-ACP methyl ester carboxylesterase